MKIIIHFKKIKIKYEYKIMAENNPNNKVLKKYSQEVQSEKLPLPCFGHTVNLISKTSIVIYGGAISTPDNNQVIL